MTEMAAPRPTPLIDRWGTLWPPEVTPPIDHEAVKQIARQIKPDAAVPIHVKRAGRLRPLSLCYWNVARVVEESKGEIVFGWQILWWPEVYVTAMHHAVWRTPDGRLIDVTKPQPGDEGGSHSVFVVDDSRAVSLEKAPSIENIFVNLCGLACVDDYIRIHKDHCAICREISEIFWELGYRCENNKAKAAGRSEVVTTKIPEGVPQYARYVCAAPAEDAIVRRLRQAIERISRRTASI